MKNLLTIMTCILTLAACGTSTSIVKQSNPNMQGTQTIAISEADPTVAVPTDMREHLMAALETNLYQQHQFQRGTEVTLRYRFIGYKEGSRLKRWLADSTGSWGEGSMTVHSQFVDQQGKVLAEMETLGRIDSGIFGGAIKSAANRIAQDVAQHATHTFK